MKAPTPTCIDLARAEVHTIPLDRAHRRRWSTAPRQVAEIVRLLRESEQPIIDFADAIGMPPSVLSRYDRGLRTSGGGARGRERAWAELRQFIKPRRLHREPRRLPREPSTEPSREEAEVRLLPDNSIEIRRVVPYGSDEHARLLPLAASRTRRAA